MSGPRTVVKKLCGPSDEKVWRPVFYTFGELQLKSVRVDRCNICERSNAHTSRELIAMENLYRFFPLVVLPRFVLKPGLLALLSVISTSQNTLLIHVTVVGNTSLARLPSMFS